MRCKKWLWRTPVMHPLGPFSLARKLVPRLCPGEMESLNLAARNAAVRLLLVAVTRLLRYIIIESGNGGKYRCRQNAKNKISVASLKAFFF